MYGVNFTCLTPLAGKVVSTAWPLASLSDRIASFVIMPSAPTTLAWMLSIVTAPFSMKALMLPLSIQISGEPPTSITLMATLEHSNGAASTPETNSAFSSIKPWPQDMTIAPMAIEKPISSKVATNGDNPLLSLNSSMPEKLDFGYLNMSVYFSS